MNEKDTDTGPLPLALEINSNETNFRGKPRMGRECFFSEAAFLRVMGPGPSLQERFHAIASRPKTQEQKKKIPVNVDMSIFDSIPTVISDVKIRKVKKKTNVEDDNAVQRISGAGEDQSVDMPESPMETDSNGGATTSETLEMTVLQNAPKEAGTKHVVTIGAEKTGHTKTCLNSDQPLNGHNNVEREKPMKAQMNVQDIVDVPNTDTTNSSDENDNAKKEFDTCETNSQALLKESMAPHTSESKSKVDEDADVCCLVMPNESDDESGGDEEPFCLVMPSLYSSDEMSSKEEFVDYTKGNYLHQQQQRDANMSVKTSPTKPVQFKSPDITISSLPHRNKAPVQNQKHNNPLPKNIAKPAANSVSALVTNSSSNPPNNPKTTLDPDERSEVNSMQSKSIHKLSNEAQISSLAGTSRQNTVTDIKTNMSNNLPAVANKTASDQSSSMMEVDLPAGPSTQKTGGEAEGTVKVFQNVRSKLSKKQHRRYIQLYKKHVCPMMKGNRKAAYSEAEMRELVELEELQQHVSEEQVEYQDYLKSKAMRNPNAYNFLTNAARIYAQSRYSSYHRPRNYIKNYDVDGLFIVPIVLEDKSASCLMTFQKTLLKLGNSARITVPDVKDGMNPIAIKVDPSTIGAWFPNSSKNLNKSKFMDHKMVSEDINALKLSEEEEIDVVMSSSSFKCLLDNHGSNVMKPWDIPVTIKPKAFGGANTVYLDKPLYRDDYSIRDFNAMYHKYALRTFVSRPRDKGVSRIEAKRSNNNSNNQSKMASRLGNRFSSDDLDLFSTGAADNIETFGSFSSTRTISSIMPGTGKVNTNTLSKADKRVEITTSGQVRRSTRLSHSDNLHSECTSVSSGNDNVPSMVSSSKPSISENHQSDSSCLRRSTRLSNFCDSQAGGNEPLLPNAKYETEPPSKVAKTDNDVLKSSSQESPTNQLKRKRGRPRLNQSVEVAAPTSSEKTESQPLSSAKQSNSCLELSIDTESPASPPLTDIQSPDKQETLCTKKPAVVPLSPVKGNAALRSNQDEAVPSILDTILGPSAERPQASASWEQTLNQNSFDMDDRDYFHAVSEKCNHVIYNQWELGSLKLLIRCNYHGAIKDKGKPRYVYLSPKMEYQADYGMEQVTLGEMTRSWASCFIRPGTSLVRTRINAFTSELMMVEEKPIDGILNPSLPFKPEHSFVVLRQIFEQLRRLPAGQYLLSHCKGDKFCKVRKFNGKASVMPAPKKKRNGKAKEGQVPWIPIDPTILTPLHIHNSRIPATFMPSDWVQNANAKKNPQGGGNKQQNHGWRGHNKQQQQQQQQKQQQQQQERQ